MSLLRKHLEQSRDLYRQARYPGDLALEALELESLRRRTRILRAIWIGAGTVAAVAACILIATMLPGRNPNPIGPAPIQLAAFPEMPSVPEMPSMPPTPTEIPTTPTEIPTTPSFVSTADAPALTNLPSMPTTPSWGLTCQPGG